MKKINLLIILIIAFNFTYSQNINHDDDEDRISSKLEECMEANPSTNGSIACIDTGTVEWDKVLNKYYGLLKNELSPEGKKKLLEAQREWLKMRDKENAFIEHYYSNETDGGTMYLPMLIMDKKDIIKKRALKLKVFYNDLKGEY